MEDNQKSKSQLISEICELTNLTANLRDTLVRRNEAEAELRKLARNLEIQVDDFTRELQKEIAQREKADLASREEIKQLAPMYSEYLQVNYAKAADLAALISGTSNGSLLSERGTVAIDERKDDRRCNQKSG